ncbi:hypothetical protein [Cohnella lubricantis]|uniref:Uncharacterized protein n=1 Tax=Cohnella lubricantis TaxID=2163172 RepID=A0A841TEI0_9BACL|nr:hypothetical protein [Cohnella lubricantis]MBB6676861.1 hypothetical protein [Cohnella lubricantis]MBP2119441.1 hypothetical protein [Cohnella lubricantis]
MEPPRRFYCLACSEVLETDRVHALFKTGFYRSEIPLGICSVCSGLNFVKKAGLAAIDWYNRSDIQ